MASTQLVRDTPPPASPGSSASQEQGSDISKRVGNQDLKQHTWSLPTRYHLEHFACRVEKAFRQNIEQLKVDTTHLGSRLETLEQKVEDTIPAITQLRDKCMAQDQRIETLISQLDDYENRSRRSNIRIRGLPEATAAKDIVPTLQGIFREILGLYPTEAVQIDKAHRAL